MSTSTPAAKATATTPAVKAKRVVDYPSAELFVSQRVVGWRNLTLTRVSLEEFIRPGAEDEADWDARLDWVWKEMVDTYGSGGSIELDEADVDDHINGELNDIDEDDGELCDIIKEYEERYNEEGRKCVLTGETEKDWNAEDELVDTVIGPVRDLFADHIPKIAELLKVKEKDDEIAKLKADVERMREEMVRAAVLINSIRLSQPSV
jgi:hypothetical protein